MKKHSHSRKQEANPETAEVAEAEEEASAESIESADAPAAEAPAAPAVEDPDPAEPETESPPSAEDVLKDRLLRLQADFDNYRKRIDREKKDWALYANEKLLKDLLPALDNFDLGLANGEKAGAPQALLDGLHLVRKQLESALANSGVMPIDAAGQPFDPNLHEAITHMPSPDVPEGSVIAQTRRGWKMGDKLLRAAQVVVSSGSPS